MKSKIGKTKLFIDFMWLAIALIYWSSSVWGYSFFFWFNDTYSRAVLVQWLILFIFIVIVAGVFLEKKLFRCRRVLKVAALNIGYLFIVVAYAYIVSIVEEHRWELICKSQHSLKDLWYLIRVIPTASAIVMEFAFLLALISGFVIRYFKKDFILIKALGVWFGIIFINEMVLQRYFLSYKNGSLLDVFNQMAVVLIGLILSVKVCEE